MKNEEEKKLRGLSFQYWLENNCCDLRSVSLAYNLSFSIVSKWRRQDDWDKKAGQMIERAARDRLKDSENLKHKSHEKHLKIVRFMIARYTKLMKDLNPINNDHDIKMNFYMDNLLQLIPIEQKLLNNSDKIVIDDIEKMYYIPPDDVVNDIDIDL